MRVGAAVARARLKATTSGRTAPRPRSGARPGDQLVVRGGVLDHGHPGVAALPPPERIDHYPIVAAVAAGLHEHRPAQPEGALRVWNASSGASGGV